MVKKVKSKAISQAIVALDWMAAVLFIPVLLVSTVGIDLVRTVGIDLVRTVGIDLVRTVASDAFAQLPGETWVDESPHEENFVQVNGVKLHYLDWGRRGLDWGGRGHHEKGEVSKQVLLFLTGMGHSAHIYDTLAPKFADRFRVLALTRRGHGQSDKPLTGYDTGTLAEDIRQLLDTLKIMRVSLVGHSMAAAEMTLFAVLYPERVEKLVYLDAAFDYSAAYFTINSSAPPERPPTLEQLASFEAFREFYKQAKCDWSEACEADMRHVISYSPDGKPLKAVMPDEVSQAIFKGLRESNPIYSKVKAPVLSFIVMGRFPDCSFMANPDAATRQKIRNFNERFVQYRRGQLDRLRKELIRGRVVEVMDDDHYFFLQKRQDEVVHQMRTFPAKRLSQRQRREI